MQAVLVMVARDAGVKDHITTAAYTATAAAAAAAGVVSISVGGRVSTSGIGVNGNKPNSGVFLSLWC